MSIEMMRYYVKRAYPGKAWEKKVSKMPDSQVSAIYQRLLNNGKLKDIK